MAAQWKKACAIDKFTAQLESARAGSEFHGFEFDDCRAVLHNLVECNNIPEGEKRRIITQSIFNAGAKGVITSDSLLGEIRELEKAFWKTPLKRYCLCTTLSIDLFSELTPRKIGNTQIKFLQRLPSHFMKSAEKIRDIAADSLTAKPPENYLNTLVSVEARSPFDAAEQAFEFIDLLRGIWNFGINRHEINRNSYGNRTPVNSIVLGPLHSLHFPDGTLATEIWWYDPDYQKPIDPYNLRDRRKKERLDKIEKSGRKLLNKQKYRPVLELGIKEYCRALDHRNWSNAFLKLWSVLEALTHTEKDNYSTTIRRASFVWTDAEYHREVLNHLRHLRNSFVHENKSTDDMEIYMYQLKRYVEALIEFHLGRGLSFSSIMEASEFMDMPIDHQVLHKRLKLLQTAVSYRKRG